MGPERRRGSYLVGYLQRRQYYVWVAVGLGIVVAVLLIVSRSLTDYGKNLSLNLGADLIGTIVVLFLIGPFLERAERRREQVLERFDHNAFIRKTGDARHEIAVLELWMDLLQGAYRGPFLKSLRAALARGVRVRILILDPDARAAEQRADDLLRQTNVVENILDNLHSLYAFIEELPAQLRDSIDVRVYSALPPVQMYRVDDHVIVSFYPVNVTSWNAAQYQTSPHAQLGTFVGTKFDELWEARSTRTLGQYRTVRLEVGTNGDAKSYEVEFVTVRGDFYVNGVAIVAGHVRTGVDGLGVRMISENAKGERREHGPFELLPVNDDETARALFGRKYGHNHHDVLLKLVSREA